MDSKIKNILNVIVVVIWLLKYSLQRNYPNFKVVILDYNLFYELKNCIVSGCRQY